MFFCSFYKLESSSSFLKFLSINSVLTSHMICHVTIFLEIINNWQVGGGMKSSKNIFLFASTFWKKKEIKLSTVEPRYNKGPRDWQNMFVITRFVNLYRGSFSPDYHIFTIILFRGLKNSSLYRGSTVILTFSYQNYLSRNKNLPASKFIIGPFPFCIWYVVSLKTPIFTDRLLQQGYAAYLK